MNHDEEMLKIERERLKMEKLRDRHAGIRFLIGSVLLVVGTSSASLYVDNKQEDRALVNSERQWIVPMLMAIEELKFLRN